MIELDQPRQEAIEDMKSTVLYYVASLPSPKSLEDLKAALEYLGFTLGSA